MIKTRYCGHLYSRLLCKWTHWDQRGQVSYCKGEVERGLERCSLLASLVGLFNGWLGCLTSSQWVLLCRKPDSIGDQPWFVGVGPLTLKASSCPCGDMLERYWRRWIACRWSDLMQLTTRGSAASVCAFQVSSVVGSPHWRWVTLVLIHGTKESHLRHVRMGNEVMPFVGPRRLLLSSGGKHPWAAMGPWYYYKRDDELHITKASGLGCTRVVDGRESGSESSYLVDPASSHMLVSKIKPCMSKYKQICTVKLRMAH